MAKILYNSALVGIFANMLAGAVFAFFFANGTENEPRWNWWLVFSLILVVRVFDVIDWRCRTSKVEGNELAGIRRYTLGCLLTAFAWAFHTVYFFDSMNSNEFHVTITILSCFTAGSVSILAVHRFTALAYSMILLVPLSFMALTSEQPSTQILGLMSTVFCLIILASNIRASRFASESISQKILNQQLIIHMQQERQRVNEVNQELEVSTAELNRLNNDLEQQINNRSEEIYRLSNIDPLTQLVNRTAFTASLKSLIERSIAKDAPLGLLFIDLNGFKKINDTMGHGVGDSVLVHVTERISAFVELSRAGRWNGDEFLVALPYSDPETSMSIASAIVTSIAQPMFVQGNELHLSASIGIAMAPQHSSSATELIQLADLTMCEQKQTGGKQPQIFTPNLKEKVTASQQILEGLQHAIQRKQLFLCYQPIQYAVDNVSYAFEALLRWDFDGVFIGPDTFIPLAEKSGLIKEIGAWVLNRACLDAMYWQHNQTAAVSVNVSVIQLMDDGFIRLIDNCLRSSGLPPQRLHLEITESTFAKNKDKIRQQLAQIQARNIEVSIDDFGTGYSSLSQLQDLSMDYVKIDKTFVDNIQGKGEAIIRATLFIARELNCRTIAEGVETKEQADALSAMGVEFLQGYYFSKPMKNAELMVWQNPITHSVN